MHRGVVAAEGWQGRFATPAQYGSRANMLADGDPDRSRARVRVYAFGEHLKVGHAGSGTLVSVPNNASTSMELVCGMLLRAAYGDGVEFDLVDYDLVTVYLLPDGEMVDRPGACGSPVVAA